MVARQRAAGGSRWVVAPPPLHELVMASKRDDDFGSPVFGQHVLARLMAGGGYSRHIRRTRHRYMGLRSVNPATALDYFSDREPTKRRRNRRALGASSNERATAPVPSKTTAPASASRIWTGAAAQVSLQERLPASFARGPLSLSSSPRSPGTSTRALTSDHCRLPSSH